MDNSLPQDVLPAICQRLCGRSLAEQLLADIDLFQNVGLVALDSNTRLRLFDRYEMEELNPYAQEVAAWLRGDYVFDPECLTA